MRIKDHINAVYLLQRFVRMSRVLLPAFVELKSKNNLSDFEEKRIASIKEVYENFKADPKTSKLLINSNILELIQVTYFRTIRNQGFEPQGLFEYDQFIKESDRLISVWDRQMMN